MPHLHGVTTYRITDLPTESTPSPDSVVETVDGGQNKKTTLESAVGSIEASGPDVVGSLPDLELSDTGVVPGMYGSGSDVPVLTIDGKGRITVASTSPVEPLDLVPDPSGIYGSSSEVPVLTVDAKGRVTEVSTAPVEPPDLVPDPSGTYGGPSFVPQIQVDQKGRVISASESALAVGLPIVPITMNYSLPHWVMTTADLEKHHVVTVATYPAFITLPNTGVPENSRLAITVRRFYSGMACVTVLGNNSGAYLYATQAVYHTSGQRRVVLLADNTLALIYRLGAWYPYYEVYDSPMTHDMAHRLMRRSDGNMLTVSGTAWFGRTGHVLRIAWLFNGSVYGIGPGTAASDDFYLMRMPTGLEDFFYHPTAPSVVFGALPVVPASGPMATASPVVGSGNLHNANWMSGSSPRAHVHIMPYLARYLTSSGIPVVVFAAMSGSVVPSPSFPIPFAWGTGHPTPTLEIGDYLYGGVSIDIPCFL